LILDKPLYEAHRAEDDVVALIDISNKILETYNFMEVK
jgi:hypothetical protein